MAEYIDREEIKNAMLKYGFKAPDMTVTEFVEDELYAADVEPVKRWISADERQPEKRGRYLVAEQNWLNKLNVQEAKWNGEDWLTVEKKREITPRVIYWMPLPELPKMDGGAEDG